jgi:hypothetical protein
MKTTKQFHMAAVVSILTGVLLSEDDSNGFNAMADVFYHLYDPFINSTGMAICQAEAAAEIYRQHPELKEGNIGILIRGDKPLSKEQQKMILHSYMYRNGSFVDLLGPIVERK